MLPSAHNILILHIASRTISFNNEVVSPACLQGSGRIAGHGLEAILSEESNGTLARFQALTPRERARLAGILARLSSPYDGERAAAGLLASTFIAKHGMTWVDLTTFLQPVSERVAVFDAPPSRQERRSGASKTWRGYCRRRLVMLGHALNWLS